MMNDNSTEHQVAYLRQALSSREIENRALRQSINELTHSLSWKITKPLRLMNFWVSKWVRQQLGYVSIKSQQVDCNDYAEWVKRFNSFDANKREAILNRIYLLPYLPKLSLLMHDSSDGLESSIASIQGQWYSNWELLIIGSDKDKVNFDDSRVKWISYTNETEVLNQVSGEFVGWIESGDLLSQDALFWFADSVASQPHVDLIYSDEDELDATAQRCNPYFKPAWNPRLLLSQNYLSHLVLYRTERVRHIGGIDSRLGDARYYDLSLRIVESGNKSSVSHIPRVLYHRRDPLKLTSQEELGVLNQSLQRRGVQGTAEIIPSGYRIKYQLLEPALKVSIIIPTRNAYYLLHRCVESILNKTTYRNYELIIVDNHSDDADILAYFEHLSTNNLVRVIRDEQAFNYSAINNQAAKSATGELLCFLNNDTEVISPAWLDELVGEIQNSHVGIVGAKLLYPNGTIQHAGIILGVEEIAGHVHKGSSKTASGYWGRLELASSFSAVTAACLLIKKTVFKAVNGFNETDLKISFNDIDLCLRVIELGYEVVWTPFAELVHHESATRGFDTTPEKQAIFTKEACYIKQKWVDYLQQDPASNPNLTVALGDLSLAWPPRIAF